MYKYIVFYKKKLFVLWTIFSILRHYDINVATGHIFLLVMINIVV